MRIKKDDMPFDACSKASLMDEAGMVMDKHLITHATLNGELAFCVREMLLSGEIQYEDAVAPFNKLVPGLVNGAQAYVRAQLDKPEHVMNDTADKFITIECTWPEHMANVYLMHLGVPEADFPVDNFPKAIDDDENTTKFFLDLIHMNEIFRLQIVTNPFCQIGNPPAEQIFAAVSFAKTQNMIGDRLFREWFPDAIQTVPDALFANQTRMKPC